jgi:DNA polymerase I-like protein with 3'-5' exonuclease and polymerase domains
MDGCSFRQIWCVDFEFATPIGDRPLPRCMVAIEYFSRQRIRLWLDGEPTPAQAPFPVGDDVLFVAYFTSAEFSCFLVLGWGLPRHVVDLYVEVKWDICGKQGQPKKPSLVYALDYYGLESLDATEKEEMRALALRTGWPYSEEEREALFNYCESDVQALLRLLPRLWPRIDLFRALFRGEFMIAVAQAEHNGIPVDRPTIAAFEEHWETLQLEMIEAIDPNHEIYEGIHFREERFSRFLCRRGIPWPRLASGRLETNDETFRDMAAIYPKLQPYRQLKQALEKFSLAELPIGKDSRSRTLLSPFSTSTGRCAPSTTQFILGCPSWMRFLIQPVEGRALAYIDWSSQEYGIGAYLSNDQTMITDYEAGDPYLGFARRIGMVPADATKRTHRAERDIIKTVILGTQYGMGAESLALRINKPVVYARNLLHAHRTAYRTFWRWSDAAVNVALFRGRLWTRFGWQTHTNYPKPTERVSGDPNIRSLANFPCQANAADMLRFAACFICDSDLMLDATLHDAVLIEGADDAIDAAVDTARRAMDRASQLVLSGFTLRTDYEVIRSPNRYYDQRGAAFFEELMARLEKVQTRPRSSRPWEAIPYGW